MFLRDKLFIGNQWVAPSANGRLKVHSPTTEELVGEVPEATAPDIDAAVREARAAFDHGVWPRMSVGERSEYLRKVADGLTRRLDELVTLQIKEMGAPRSFIQGATAGTIASIQSAIGRASRVRFREFRDGHVGKVLVIKEPVGVVGAIIPWNGPVPMVISKMLVPLLTGSSIVIKPAEESPLSAYLCADAFFEAGLPAGTVSIVPGGRAIGEHLVTHPGVDKISFTGSTAAGERVGSLCGSQIKAVTLELGGKSAAILLDDVNLPEQMPALLKSAMPNNGQLCYATTRILAPRARYAEVVDELVRAVSALELGDPDDPTTIIGPLVAERQRDRVEAYIRCGLEQGARLVLGGGRPATRNRGWFVEPTIFADVDNAMTIAQEEIFGPVITVTPYDDDDDAIRLANDSQYGLGGAVFTGDIERGIAVAAQIRTGSCTINDAPGGGGGGPFGGYKRSGLGREHGAEGWDGYLETKTVTLPASYRPAD